jgi:histidinol-phosphate aminotransferase
MLWSMNDPLALAPLLRPELASIEAYVPTPARVGAIRLDANESPHPLPAEARELLARSLAEVALHRYPDVRATHLRAIVAEREGVHPDQVVFGNGSDEVIALILGALARPRRGRERAAVAFPDPSFVMFRVSTLASGAHPVAVPLDDAWDLDLDGFAAALGSERPNVVFLPSPNNPTGNLFARDRIERLISLASDALVVLDEAYGAYAGVRYADLMREDAPVGRLQTLSKLGLAGARVGWGILPLAVARAVDKVRQPYNLDALSQRAAELCLTTLAPYFEAAVASVVAERGRVASALSAIGGIRVAPSQANFLWVELPGDAGAVHTALLARGIVVRSFHARGGRLARWVRITVGTPAENDALLEALPHCLG